jgi:riboflavin kinase/FMN adenylyltransferase
MAKANNYLDYNYSLWNGFFQGKQLGRTIGFPANIKIEEDDKLIPERELSLQAQSIIVW